MGWIAVEIMNARAELQRGQGGDNQDRSEIRVDGCREVRSGTAAYGQAGKGHRRFDNSRPRDRSWVPITP